MGCLWYPPCHAENNHTIDTNLYNMNDLTIDYHDQVNALGVIDNSTFTIFNDGITSSNITRFPSKAVELPCKL